MSSVGLGAKRLTATTRPRRNLLSEVSGMARRVLVVVSARAALRGSLSFRLVTSLGNSFARCAQMPGLR